MDNFFADYPVTGGNGVTSLNGLTGALTLIGAGGITITPAGSNITITGSGGTVTSVGLADGSTVPLYAISGSPVTTSGTLTFTLMNQSANTVFAGPATGLATEPTFRSLVSADLPDLSGLYANVFLSNLDSPTAINQSLIFGSGVPGLLQTTDDTGTTQNLVIKTGAPATSGDNSGSITIFTSNNGSTSGASGSVGIASGSGGSTSGAVSLSSGASRGGGSTSGAVTISTGEGQLSSGVITIVTGTGDVSSAGGIILEIGTAPTRGHIRFVDGSEGTAGNVWTSTDTLGNGAWHSASSGSVTSVALADGSTVPIFTISGSPVTTSGTLTQTLAVQNANLVFAGPTTGSAAQPAFRSLVSADIPNLSAVYVPQTEVGAANGVAPLDGSGKVPYTNLPSALMTFKGAWNPTTNTPTLTNGTGLTGDTYRASVGGTSTAPIADTWFAGDFIIYNGTIWQRSPLADGVISVNGLSGAVTVNAINQLTGDATAGPASGSQSAALTLATVNANVGSFTNANITVNAKGLITAASNGISGTVTSVALADSTGLFNITGSPVTSSGTLTLASFQSQAQNTFFAAPSGSSGAPTFRTIVASDVPTLNQNTTGSSASFTGSLLGDITGTQSATVLSATTNSTLTTLSGLTSASSLATVGTITTGTWHGTTIDVAHGGTGQTSLTAHDVLVGNGTGAVTLISPSTSGDILTSNGTGADPSFQAVPGNTTILKAPVITAFTTGSGIYTTPTTPAPLYLRVRLVGAGGGGGGSGTTTTAGNGTAGGNTTFGTSLLIGNGGGLGLGGRAAGVSGGGGGTGTFGAASGIGLAGATGGFGGESTDSQVELVGGTGGSSAFGGEGPGGGGAGTNASTNTGSGGGGAGSAGNASVFSGSGGGAGGFTDAIITTPAATYAYAVGAKGTGGAAGTTGAAGGNGADGLLEITEYYQ